VWWQTSNITKCEDCIIVNDNRVTTIFNRSTLNVVFLSYHCQCKTYTQILKACRHNHEGILVGFGANYLMKTNEDLFDHIAESVTWTDYAINSSSSSSSSSNSSSCKSSRNNNILILLVDHLKLSDIDIVNASMLPI